VSPTPPVTEAAGPSAFDAPGDRTAPSRWDNHIRRRLSAMRGQFLDTAAFEQRLAEDDAVLYEVYEMRRPEAPGHLLHGISVVHPGRVGREYFMTKGHFHAVLETAEVYHCLRGRGVMVMETPEGECAVEPLAPGRVLYVPPRWAHRSVNTGDREDLVLLFVYPAHAGHDYKTIERRGFRTLVLAPEGASGSEPVIAANPRWGRREEPRP
jgi:glucose-6-phosphate isomerase